MRLRKPVEGIFFDLGWTLLKPASGDWLLGELFYEFVGKDVFDRFPVELALRERVEAALKSGLAVLDEDHILHTEQEEYDQFFRFFEDFAKAIPELELSRRQILDLAHDKVYNDGNYIIFDDSEATLEALRGKYKLGIISDTWPSIERVIRNAGLLPYFDTVTFSCHQGVCKPHEKMYKDALARMKLPAQRTVFIDDFPHNLDGAAKVGIQPVLITAKPGAVALPDYPCIDTISGLLSLLD